jgi:pimeloyl-ACP methyl ester carboxylesterase
LISSKNYPVEIHFAETPDNYVLQMFRIPRPGAPVAFLQHGLLDSSTTWVLNEADNSLAFIMYDAGFDVWLGNSRGNTYSMNNTRLSPDSKDFWKFDWDEMAKYDMPTQVDYALAASNRTSVTYIGHSQGTTQAFANAAVAEWDIKSKVNLFVALAPVAYVYHTPSIFIQALADLDIDRVFEFFGVSEFLPTSKFLRWLLPEVCDVTPLLCESVIYLFAGLDLGDLDKSRLDVYVSHFPSGTSVRDVSHWAQEVRSKRFCQNDFGILGNLAKYGTAESPAYDIRTMEAPPIAIFNGGKDVLADPADVDELLGQLPAGAVVSKTYTAAYGHLDYVWGEHAYLTIYPQVVALAKKYANQ